VHSDSGYREPSRSGSPSALRGMKRRDLNRFFDEETVSIFRRKIVIS
jgi:hypothetical protein